MNHSTPDDPPFVEHDYFVCHKTDPTMKSLKTSDPEEVATFLWGKAVFNYLIYKVIRLKSRDTLHIAQQLKDT